MNTEEHYALLKNTRASDTEIAHYAVLLDGLGIGLAVFDPQGNACSSNEVARSFFGDTTPSWFDEKNVIIAPDEQPQMQTLQTGEPVCERIVALKPPGKDPLWLSASAFAVFSEEDRLRRVLLTLKNISEERRLKLENERLAVTDPISGTFNEHHVLQLLENEIHRARRYGTPFSLAMIHIDQLPDIKASYGKEAVEKICAQVGRLIRESMREIDIAGCYGSEEYLLILPNVRLQEAIIGLERLRVVIKRHDFEGPVQNVTISGGVTEDTGEPTQALIERSRSLLLQAQQSGRNRFCMDTEIF